MKITVTARHGHLSDEVQRTIEEKVQKLPRFFERTTAIEVTVDWGRGEVPIVEVKVSVEHSDDFFAADSAPNVLAAVDSVVHKLERQLTRHKEKLTDHRGKSPRHSAL